MSTSINWSVASNDPLLMHPLYQKYANTSIGTINPVTLSADIKGALASNESAPVLAYLCWLVRVMQLVA